MTVILNLGLLIRGDNIKITEIHHLRIILGALICSTLQSALNRVI